MPVFPVPYDHGSAVALTGACVLMTSDGIFGNAECGQSQSTDETPLTAAEFRACNWRRIVSARYNEHVSTSSGFFPELFRSVVVRISVYGADLSDSRTGVRNIWLRPLLDVSPRLSMFKQLTPRMSWMAYYAGTKERRTALAMAFHRRLGGDSDCLIRQLDDDLMRCILGFGI